MELSIHSINEDNNNIRIFQPQYGDIIVTPIRTREEIEKYGFKTIEYIPKPKWYEFRKYIYIPKKWWCFNSWRIYPRQENIKAMYIGG